MEPPRNRERCDSGEFVLIKPAYTQCESVSRIKLAGSRTGAEIRRCDLSVSPVPSIYPIHSGIFVLKRIPSYHRSHAFHSPTHIHLGAEVAPCVSPGKPRVPSSTRCSHSERQEAPLDESGSSPLGRTENEEGLNQPGGSFDCRQRGNLIAVDQSAKPTFFSNRFLKPPFP